MEHDKEGETDDINEGDAENDEKGEEGVGGTIDTRILEEGYQLQVLRRPSNPC